MANRLSKMNWEKVSVYLTLTGAFLTIISHLFGLKDDISEIKERLARVEVKVEHLEGK